MNETNRISAALCLLLWLVAAGLLFVPLLFIPRVMIFGNSDALFYSNILVMMTESLKSGDLFPRWLAQANAGLGSPVMLFYAPLGYIVTALFDLPLAPMNLTPEMQLVFGMFASQLVCGLTSFLWLKRHFPQRVALAGSLLFILLPYKFIYIYLHINLAQLWALAILPLWMMAAEGVAAGRTRAVGAYALAFAGVYYTHPLTLIAFAAAPAAYVFWFGRGDCAPNIARLTIAHLLGLGMCLMQLLPAHYTLPWIQAQRFLQGNYDWKNNLYHVDVVLCAYYGMIAVVVAVALNRIPALAKTREAGQGLFWIAVLCVILFLTQKPSAFVYEWITPLQYLQFPAARLHAAALMAGTYLICFWLAFHTEMAPLGRVISSRKALAIMIASFTIATGAHLYHLYSDPAFYSGTYLGDAQAAKLISTPVPVYETQDGCIEMKRAYYLYEHHRIPAEVAFTSGEGTVASLVWQPPDRIAFTADVRSETARLTLRQCYFPLWLGWLDGHPLNLSPVKPDGLTGLTLPQGSHRVEMSLSAPQGSAAGGWISFVSLAVSLLLITSAAPKRAK